jgi:hypothetical protein
MLKPLLRIANSAAVAGRASKTIAAAQKSAVAAVISFAARLVTNGLFRVIIFFAANFFSANSLTG